MDPYGLVSKAGVWYLVADLDGGPRLLRADRVLAADTTGEPVRRRPGATLAEVWAGLREQVERLPSAVPVRARVRQGVLDMVVRIHAGRLLAPPPPAVDGWAELELGFPALPAVRALLAFGGDVEVLSPPEARAELARAATSAVGIYRGD